MSNDMDGVHQKPDCLTVIDGGVTAPSGFRAAGVACGLKKSKRDLALIVSEKKASAAGVFTQNVVKGHSLQLCRRSISDHKAQAVVINSGNANACVGPDGFADAEKMAACAAEHIGCTPSDVLTGSTGVIGQRLNIDAVTFGIDLAFGQLSDSREAARAAETAILTTDLRPKSCAVTCQVGGRQITIGGMAKGSGMIHPNMATMIAVLTTDCQIEPMHLQALLSQAVNPTFNRISVDGDTSVCDMVVVLANGMAGNTVIDPGSEGEQILLQALTYVCSQLAQQIVADGEGATKMVDIRVKGARDAADAYRIVQSVGRSPLVKTALFGEDANWGRILTAAGYSGADFDPAGCDIYLGDLQVCSGGLAVAFDEMKAKQILKQNSILIQINLQDGSASDHLWTCDFSDGYIRINGSYRS